MWGDMTYENILNDMLNRVTFDVDKREGSVIYDALAPCAYKLAENYFMLGAFLDLVFGDTATGEYLDRVVADSGLTRKQATYAIRQIETDTEVDIGARWGLGETSYIITELISTNKYKARCEQIGAIGNAYSGELANIDNVSATATLTSIITQGDDTETDDNLRARFYRQVRASSTSGNVYDYMKWALEVPGCGDAKVFPLWNGNGTVKVLVVDENMAIDTTLPARVYEYMESVRPIGATVTVESPQAKAINVTASITLDGSKTLGEVNATFTGLLAEYLKELVFETYSVSYARIGSLLLATSGVEDYSGLLINGASANIIIVDTEMPILGNIDLSEVV